MLGAGRLNGIGGVMGGVPNEPSTPPDRLLKRLPWDAVLGRRLHPRDEH